MKSLAQRVRLATALLIVGASALCLSVASGVKTAEASLVFQPINVTVPTNGSVLIGSFSVQETSVSPHVITYTGYIEELSGNGCSSSQYITLGYTATSSNAGTIQFSTTNNQPEIYVVASGTAVSQFQPNTTYYLRAHTQCSGGSFRLSGGKYYVDGVDITTLGQLSATTSYQTRITAINISQEGGGGGEPLEPATPNSRVPNTNDVFEEINIAWNYSGFCFDFPSFTHIFYTVKGSAINNSDLIPIADIENSFNWQFDATQDVNQITIGCYDGTYHPDQYNAEYDGGATIFQTIPYTGGGGGGGGDVVITADYVINQTEIITSVSEKNPTQISFSLSKRPATSTTARGEAIDNTVATGTVATAFAGLADGSYDVLVKFSNTGCSLGLSACPFPLSYIYSSFTVSSGTLSYASSSNEQYNNVVPPPAVTQYEDCGFNEIAGCINNSLRFLFIPSNESIDNLVAVKDNLDTRIPFVYVSDIRTVADELFNTAQAETLDVELNLGFGTIPFINEDMIANTPQASLIRLLLSYLLWIAFAFGAYRMALGIHNKEVS